MDLQNFRAWFSTLPKAGKVLTSIALILLIIVILFFTSSCGASKATVRVYNRADSTETTISVSNGDGGSTSVTVSPKIQIDSTKIL